MPSNTLGPNRKKLNEALDQMKIAAMNFGYSFIKDVNVRTLYLKEIKTMSDSILEAYNIGRISAEEGAKLANQMRNDILTKSRASLSRLGLAYSEKLKKEGKTLQQLLDHYAGKKYKKAFDQLDDAGRESVFVEVIKASGRDRGRVTRLMPRFRMAGRICWVITIAASGYNIFTSENKTWATGREITALGGGFAGGAAVGAAAGIWFGPIGVAVGVVIGGALGALVADESYLAFAGPELEAASGILRKYTGFFNTDEIGIAKALIERGIVMDEVYIIFREMDANYSGDADDVAIEYVEQLKRKGHILKLALTKHQQLVNLLIRILDDGWTSGREKSAIQYLQSLQGL